MFENNDDDDLKCPRGLAFYTVFRVLLIQLGIKTVGFKWEAKLRETVLVFSELYLS